MYSGQYHNETNSQSCIFKFYQQHMVRGQHSLRGPLASAGTSAANYVVYHIEPVLIGGLDNKSIYSHACAVLCCVFINR